MSNPEATPNRMKSQPDQEKFSCNGYEYVKIKPFSFKSFLEAKACGDYDSVLVAFAKKFGTEKDVSAKELMEFLENDVGDDVGESAEWLEKRGFIREVNPEQSFSFGTKFFDRKREVVLISCDDDFAILDLKTFRTPYGSSSDHTFKNKITRRELYEYLEGFGDKEFEEFINSAH